MKVPGENPRIAVLTLYKTVMLAERGLKMIIMVRTQQTINLSLRHLYFIKRKQGLQKMNNATLFR